MKTNNPKELGGRCSYKQDFRPLATTCIDLQGLRLSEISQVEKDIQLTLAQHKFELQRSTWDVFS